MTRSFKMAVLLITMAVLCLTGHTFAQNQDPLIGTWNESGAATDGSLPFIAIMNINAGGTTIETDTGGGNSSTVESINLGKWRKVGVLAYSFKDQNYIYDTSGNLADININVCTITLDPGLKSFSGNCNFGFYTCSLTQCPGSLLANVPGAISGTRF